MKTKRWQGEIEKDQEERFSKHDTPLSLFETYKTMFEILKRSFD
jgi:hypothetical protein